MSNRNFTMVPGTLWTDQKFKSLPSDADRLLYVYLFASGHQNLAGVYTLPDGYAATDTGWATESYLPHRKVLADAGLIEFDGATSEVMIVGWFRWNPAIGPKVVKGIEKVLANVTSQRLKENQTEAFREAQLLQGQAAESSKRGATLLNTAHMKRALGHRDD